MWDFVPPIHMCVYMYMCMMCNGPSPAWDKVYLGLCPSYTYVCIHVYMYTYIYTHTYICTHTHTHTHTHLISGQLDQKRHGSRVSAQRGRHGRSQSVSVQVHGVRAVEHRELDEFVVRKLTLFIFSVTKARGNV